GDHRLDGQGEPLDELGALAGPAEVRDVGRLVHGRADAVPDVVLDDAVRRARGAHVLLDRVRDVGDPAAQPGGGDAGPQRGLGDLEQRRDLAGDRADGHRDRGVAVPPVDDRTAVDGDHVTLGEDPVVGDAVDDHVVDRGAQGAGEAVVAQERGHRAGRTDRVLRDRVQLPGRDPGPDMTAQQLQRPADHEAGTAHVLDLLGRLDLDAAVAEAHGTSGQAGPSWPRAAKTRARTSSTVPMPSTSRTRPRSPYTAISGAVSWA